MNQKLIIQFYLVVGFHFAFELTYVVGELLINTVDKAWSKKSGHVLQ